ncbi:MAG: hypothetical protein A2X04_00725 [Bacteroidetes bacterium GWF2_41_9]|nr:MAG: hypothetical protein A2X04_00725 [Bacteroidetes bacterium GWF2_41_9]
MGVLYLERRYVKKAIEYLEKARGIYEKNNFVKQYTVYIYHYLADAYIYEYINEKDRLVRKQRNILLKKIKKYCKIALNKTRHWPTHYGGALRVNAKYCALIKDNYKAERLFIESIELCEKNGRKYELAKGMYEYGIFLEYVEKVEESRKYLELAYNLFKEIDSKVYERRVAELLGIAEDGASSTERFSRELRYSQRLSSIITLSRDISSVLDLDELLRRIMTVAIQVTGAKNGYLMIKDEKTYEIKTWVMEDLAGSDSEQDEFSKSIVNQVFQTGQAVLTTNAMEDEKFYNFHSIFVNELKSILCVPLKYNNEIKGVCYLSNSLSSGVFTDESLDVLTAIMTQAAISLENATLYKLAITDGLTELYTHMHFKFLLKKMIESSKKNEHQFALIIFDIDKFKKFNDAHGHQAGDMILSSLARVVKEVLRIEDVAARYGGEEFAVILSETDEAKARVVAGRLKHAISSNVVEYNGQNLSVTISMGISIFPLHADDSSTLIRLADEAMYLSKENGRNTITVYGK